MVKIHALAFMAVLSIGFSVIAAHTDAPPGRYDYTAKVAAADGAGKAANAGDRSAEEALALADRTYEYVAKALGEKVLADEKAELEADRRWLSAAKTAIARKTVEKEIRRLRRRILFRHPDLQFKALLAVQRGIPYSRENHMVDQYLGRWSRPGPGLVVLEDWQTAPKKKSLLGDKLPAGTVINPDLHWNADRILFSFCDHTAKPPADAQRLKVPEVVVRDDEWIRRVDPTHPIYGPGFKAGGERAVAHRRYFIYECAADGSWVKQLTGCKGDKMETQGGRQTALIEDIDPCYLPDGGFVFSSTRGQNYGRCHWGRYVPSFLLYRADAGGKNIRQISFGEANEWEPAVMNDGRIAYTRWDYINRHAVWFQSLWATRPDGTAVSHIYGNYSEDIGVVTETKAIPGSRLLLCTASAHHNITSGSLFLLDPAVDEDGLKPVTRVTPEVPFPESEGWNTPGAYCSPFPVNDTLFFCSYSDETLGYPDDHPRHRREEYMAAWPSPAAFGIWLVDTLGGREFIYADPEISTFNPIPLVKRPMPPALVSALPPPESAPTTGVCYVENVYDCRTELPKGAIAALRINKLDVMGACRRETLNQHDDLDLHKESLGAVTVAADGSAMFNIPAGVPIQLQAVDTNGIAVFTMRSFIYSQKGEIQGCAGCHENKFKSGAKYTVRNPAGRKALDPVPEVDLGYTGPFSFTKSVQPIFDRHCISCHGLGEGPKKDAFSLIGTNGIFNLIARKQISFAASYRETPISKPYDYFTAASPLWKKVLRGHGGAKLSKDELQTLALWMDLNVTEFTVGGGYSWNRPESRLVDPEGEKHLRAAIADTLGPQIAAQPFDSLVNRGMEERSRILWLVKPVDRARFLLLVKAALKPHPAHDILGTCGRDDACECNSCWVRRGGYNKEPYGHAYIDNGRYDYTAKVAAADGAGKAVNVGDTRVEDAWVHSPDGKVDVGFVVVDGLPRITVGYDAGNVATIDLGLVLEEPYQGGFAIEGTETGGADAVWKPVWGERAEIRDAHRDCSVLLRERGTKARRLRIEMRAYPEGFAFRYVLLGEGREKVMDESTRAVFAPGSVAWPIYHAEDTYPAEPIDAVRLLPAPGARHRDSYMLPLTVRCPNGVCASLFEAYVRHYPRALGELVGGGTKIRLHGDLLGRTRGTATVDLPFEGPWRVIQLGKDAAALVENATLVLNLNPPCAIKDTSYIQPGLCLSDLSNCAMNNRDIFAAAQRERVNGIRHFQIDWGWYGTEWTWSEKEMATYEKNVPDADVKFSGWRNNVVADPRRSAKGYVPYRPNFMLDYGTTVDLDVPKLVKELASIGVDLALYMHGRVLEAEKDLDELFALYRQWGVVGLKPGFVRYGDAESTDWNRMLVEAAARHRLWLDIHDAHIPDGMQRTYPNLLLCEGGGGEEGNHPVRQDVSLPFARCLVGPFDYTPKLFRDDRTHAHSAAMLLVYPGPVAILRGSAVKREWGPELDFVRRLPMTYDETKVPVADIGKTLVVARRRGDVWYVAGICGEEGFDAGFRLDFLGRSSTWKAELCADGANGRAVASTRRVSGGDWFTVKMDKAGGFTLILTRE